MKKCTNILIINKVYIYILFLNTTNECNMNVIWKYDFKHTLKKTVVWNQ